MRNIIIGIIIGLVLGVVAGATVISKRLQQGAGKSMTGPTLAERRDAESALTRVGQKAVLAPNEPLVRWRMAGAFAGNLPQMGSLARRLEQEITRVSGHEMEVKFHEPGTLVAPLEIFDAVKSGTIDAAFATPALWADKSPALSLFASVPFGPSAREYLAWIYFGGGRELYQGLYRKHGLHGLFCGMIAPEASGWFRKPVLTVDDLKGLTMSTYGLGAKVLERLGVQTRVLTGGDIFVALEKGLIDAAEFSQPAVDLKLGFHTMARHYYFPGWHQPATLFDLVVNEAAWIKLPPVHKAQLEAVCGDNIRHGLAEGEAQQFQALKELTALGVKIERWPEPVLDALRSAWGEVSTAEAKKDPDFRAAWTSLSSFREDYSIWQELSEF